MTADDVVAGKAVTVIRWREVPATYKEPSAFGLWGNTESTPTPKRDYMGEVLIVAAVSLPYILCRRPQKDNQIVTLDLRQCEVTPLQPEYVDAMLKAQAEKKSATTTQKDFEQDLYGIYYSGNLKGDGA